MTVAALMAVLTAGMGLLMVSNFEYYSPKVLSTKGRVPFITLVAVVLVFAVMLADPPRVLLVLFAGYALSGPAKYLWQRWRARARSARGHATEKSPVAETPEADPAGAQAGSEERSRPPPGG